MVGFRGDHPAAPACLNITLLEGARGKVSSCPTLLLVVTAIRGSDEYIVRPRPESQGDTSRQKGIITLVVANRLGPTRFNKGQSVLEVVDCGAAVEPRCS